MLQGSQGSLPILLVDDDPQLLLTARLVLEHSGYTDTVSFTDGREALEYLEKHGASLIVLDLMMPEMSGIDALLRIEERFPHVPVIIMTGTNEVETAVQCMKSGAFDYLVKPIDRDRFIATIRRAFEMASLKREVTSLKKQLLSGEPSNAGAFSSIVTRSGKMLKLFQYIEVLAGTAQPVLITGETGVGKELLARTINTVSGLKGPFIAVNVAGLDDTIFSDTLFGHVRGAFTGADKDREGLIAKASGGTLLLDEIGEINIASQLKLLRLLQEGDYYPLGSDTPKKSRARIVAATNKSLSDLVDRGVFRNDLYFRLRGHQITAPPLRERMEDIPLLFDRFLEEAAEALNKKKPAVPPELFTLLATYNFPGNVRELKSMVYDALARHRTSVLSTESFRAIILGEHAADSHTRPIAEKILSATDRLPTLREAEDSLITEALRRSGGNQSIAASLLGINRSTLNKRLNRKHDDDPQ